MAGTAGMMMAITKMTEIRPIRPAAQYARARKTWSPEMSRRWRFATTSGAGATPAVPRLIRSSGRDGEEDAASRGYGLERIDIKANDVGRQLRIVNVARILLTFVDGPVEQVDQRRALGFVRLIFAQHDPDIP